jgi:hypothetical protein
MLSARTSSNTMEGRADPRAENVMVEAGKDDERRDGESGRPT